MQVILDNAGLGYATQRTLLSLWQQMYKYAIANDITDRNYAEYVHVTVAERRASGCLFRRTKYCSSVPLLTRNPMQMLSSY